jgi:hypothetical protein
VETHRDRISGDVTKLTREVRVLTDKVSSMKEDAEEAVHAHSQNAGEAFREKVRQADTGIEDMHKRDLIERDAAIEHHLSETEVINQQIAEAQDAWVCGDENENDDEDVDEDSDFFQELGNIGTSNAKGISGSTAAGNFNFADLGGSFNANAASGSTPAGGTGHTRSFPKKPFPNRVSGSTAADMMENRGRSTESKFITAVISDVDEDGVDDEQDVEEATSVRRFNEQDKVIVPSFPTIVQLSNYRTQLGTNLVTAGGRTDCKEILWLSEVFNKSHAEQFERLSNSGGSRFGGLDIKLATALVASIKAAPAHRMLYDEVLAMQQKCTDMWTILKGRHVYFMIIRYYATTESLDLVYSIEHLTKLQWLGDNEIHTFRDTWENILRNMG